VVRRWVDPPYGRAHRVGWVERVGRLGVGLVLAIVDLQLVLASDLTPDDEVVHRGEDVILRFHLGGLRPSEDAVSVRLTSDSVDRAALDAGTTWMGDGLLVVLPTDGLADGRHEVSAQVSIVQRHATLSIGAGAPAVFVVRP
jgi:hypothetical protein